MATGCSPRSRHWSYLLIRILVGSFADTELATHEQEVEDNVKPSGTSCLVGMRLQF
ncbi:unnamed protein product [Arabis nemorensis]|uniref:Uncharacterized protein n=1 Tax=Arabis nemorensis TaxID=586526 RepID=A0A565CJG4_9BRAS|nr:unnamed protein product [Arabis nemorensis]